MLRGRPAGGGSGNGARSIARRGNNTTPYLDFADTNVYDYVHRLISTEEALIVRYGIVGGTAPAHIFAVDGPMRASAYNTTSDARFKTRVRPIGGALASGLAPRGVRYDWNALGGRHGSRAGAVAGRAPASASGHVGNRKSWGR